jgi:hypothetical protein
MDTDIQKAMLARSVPGLAEFLQVHSQASLQVALQKLRSIRFANDQLGLPSAAQLRLFI